MWVIKIVIAISLLMTAVCMLGMAGVWASISPELDHVLQNVVFCSIVSMVVGLMLATIFVKD